MTAWLCTVLFTILGVQASAPPADSTAIADGPPAAAPIAAPVSDAAFLRVHEHGTMLELQVGVRRYAGPAATDADAPRPPTITLVAIAHIGDAELYRQIQELLDQHEVVLYESVKPAGAAPSGGATDEQRIESTRSAVKFVARLLESFHRERLSYPACLNDLQEYAQEQDARLGGFLAQARVDAWRRPLRYQPIDERYTLISLGADGELGGDGAAADLAAADLGPIEPFKAMRDDGLQAELARTLGLRFQLDAMDYDRPNWRCSDLAVDQVERALRDRGVNFAPIRGALTGTSLPARIVRLLLGMIRLMDRFSGAAVDMIKVMLIEMLGDQAVVSQALSHLGPAMAEVIIGHRNQVVVDDLKAMIEREPSVGSVAVLYGGGHMADLAIRLRDQLGYQPDGEATWITAIGVDLAKSSIDPAQLRQMRFMIRQSLRQQLGAPPPRGHGDRAESTDQVEIVTDE